MPNSSLPPQPADATSTPDTVALSDVLPAIERADVEGAALLRAHPGRVTATRLPFYADASLLRAEAWLPARPVVLRYVQLHRGDRVLPLGSVEAVLAANVAADLRLTAQNALAYLRYYLESVGGRTPRRVVERPDDLRLLPEPEPRPGAATAREQALARVHPASVQPDLAGGVRVTATTLRGRTIEAVTFVLKPDGRVTEERVTTLVEDAPVVWTSR